jgi:hypothetical protein
VPKTSRVMPWIAAIGGAAVAAWSLLRLKLRGPPPYGHGRRGWDDDPLADPLILTGDVRDAVAEAVGAQHAAERPDGGSRMAALSLPGEPRTVLGQRFKPLPAAGAAPDVDDLPLLHRSQPAAEDRPLERVQFA